ncbi:MAG: helix-turn-helix domain-containing protein [Lactococcus lactis]|uniref:helix-turn-helix domain-containing protein n=1 Tax=Lactococcus lactis TaxID=1358 RepID=UPI00207CDBAC|nr:helix-turn-helix transcriptional regulator [Lactococcus lactis]MDN6023874.1 helix-turn-helix domain-containing protein [Lactobacillus sp.]MCO0817289.1 helix-turn-helix domain-containing protein [Lactococcus lactis]MDN6011482.1 helix-turn-helix domain-containing protein [Lactococcus lactis]MDN6079375.1 helix-turn-helix domain-containing protein [Lactococcus lactis]MDN6096187.1 helix-turn-helix domain-containing protein [Lactococcus lactis]
MEIGKRIRAYRKIYNLSQEQLAEKIFVSRQTVSNWENNKTYPDIQIIVSLSILFNVSLDELIREDLEEMKMKISNNKANKRADIYSLIMICSTILASLSIGLVLALPESKFIWIVPVTLFLPALWSSFVLEKFKRNNDLKTYKEILAFSQNKDLEVLRKKRDPRRTRIEKGIIVLAYAGLTLLICLMAIFIANFFK